MDKLTGDHASDDAMDNPDKACCQPQNCEQFQRRLYVLLDGECDPEESERLEKHLNKCPECAAEIGSVEAIRALLRRCCQQTAPEKLRQRITSRIHTRVERRIETRIQSGGVEQRTTEYRVSYHREV
ncbi:MULTISPECIES: mycothiol system anti-sigma-R factor [unclassified Corynebacterium]|uniref:mycothiol system anti-sigma-R factor n=1 Tax=unclassified Corynebacterium TaxID=2624378 RepID=UPI0030A4A8CF